jgi:hypothetical protein
MTLGADMSGSIDDLELVLETDCERLNEKGVKGGDPYVQRRGMKTRKISETEKAKDDREKRTEHDRLGSSADGSPQLSCSVCPHSRDQTERSAWFNLAQYVFSFFYAAIL